MILWRCDVCQELIDPVEGDERATLQLIFQYEGGEGTKEQLDLCENCRPENPGGFVDWLIHSMEDR